jgi:coenzyme F420 hydrogenase subunit beta
MTAARRVDPAADVRDDVAHASGVPELADKIWFHKTAAAVIDAGRCVGCAGCVAACPSRSIAIAADGKPTLVRMCTGCSACWDFCPLAGLRTERLAREAVEDGDDLGGVRAAVSARALAPAAGAQDGGVVTELVATLLERGAVDGAVVTRRLDAFRGEAFIATTPDEVRDAAGSVYHQGYPLAVLRRPLPSGVRSLALVGTPCQLTVLHALRRYPWRYRTTAADAVTLSIGLFCSRSFDPFALMRALVSAGVDLAAVDRLDVRGGRLRALAPTGGEVATVSLGELDDAALVGCEECSDFAALSADIAVGNVGSDPGRSTVLVRTEAGARAWAVAAGRFYERPLEDLTTLGRVAGRDRRRATERMPRRFDPSGPVWISYAEHLEAFAGTGRAPVAPPAHRSHHYEVSC